MLKSKKHVFWEALVMTCVIFIFGLLVGLWVEESRFNSVEDYYARSEISVADMIVLQELSKIKEYDCDALIKANINFANKIYQEAVLLEEYESASRITGNLILSHTKYDLLRAFVWSNTLDIFNKCEKKFVPVVYLYEYNTDDLEQKAKQRVWSNILYDVKQKYADKIILLPIAVNMNLTSVDVLIEYFDIQSYPSVVIGDKTILYDLETVEKVEKYIEEEM